LRSSKQRTAVLVAGAAALVAVAGCSSSTPTASSSSGGAAATTTSVDPVALYHPGLPGLKISVFARFAEGTQNQIAPDSITIDGNNVFIGFQNVTAKDCTDGPKTSTIVEYTMAGTVVKKFSIPGHNDGLRVDPTTHLVWATSCEDGNPQLNVIDPTSGTVTPYTFPATPHGGGYDDLWYMKGKMFIAASNPTLDANGNNVFPAIDSVALSGSKAVLTTVLMANATATDTIAGTPTTLNLTDPDSFSMDNQGQLVLVSQGDSRLVLIANPGTPQQKVTTTPVGNQLDDTVWSTALHGRLLITDGNSNAIYWVHVDSVAGTIYTEAPNDSGVPGFIGTLDLTTGFMHPVMIGFAHPTGMAYVPDPAH
jgi:hypothetical protein